MLPVNCESFIFILFVRYFAYIAPPDVPARLLVILVSVILNDVVFAILNAPPVVPATLLFNVESVISKVVRLFSSMLIAPPDSPAVLSDSIVSSIVILMLVHPSSMLIAPPP